MCFSGRPRPAHVSTVLIGLPLSLHHVNHLISGVFHQENGKCCSYFPYKEGVAFVQLEPKQGYEIKTYIVHIHKSDRLIDYQNTDFLSCVWIVGQLSVPERVLAV